MVDSDAAQQPLSEQARAELHRFQTNILTLVRGRLNKELLWFMERAR